MNELEVKNAIKKSMAEPKTPEDLMRATIERGKAIELGRLAEKKLAALKSAAPSKETKMLAAQGIIGRYMLAMPAKKGLTAEKMVGELLKNKNFDKATNLTADKLLEGLQTGKLVKSMVQPTKEEKVKTALKNEVPGLSR